MTPQFVPLSCCCCCRRSCWCCCSCSLSLSRLPRHNPRERGFCASRGWTTTTTTTTPATRTSLCAHNSNNTKQNWLLQDNHLTMKNPFRRSNRDKTKTNGPLDGASTVIPPESTRGMTAMTTGPSSSSPTWQHTIPPDQPVELGTIHYTNLTPDGRHGDFDRAVAVAHQTGKPIFANFVEWSG